MARTLEDINLRCFNCGHHQLAIVHTKRSMVPILEFELDGRGYLVAKRTGEPIKPESYEWTGYECPKCGEFAQSIEGLIKD